MTNPVRWGILGSSTIATRRVIPAMRDNALATVLGLASRDLDRARRTADEAGIPRAYGGYEALLKDPDIEAVYIPLPNTLHLEWSLKALAHGKHVLCEKPLAMNAAEAEVLAEAAARSGLVVEEGFAFVNHPQWDFLLKTIASDDIGAVRAVHATLSYNNFNPADLRNNPGAGGGALYDIGCYAIMACRLLFGDEPAQVIGLVRQGSHFWRRPADQCVAGISPGPCQLDGLDPGGSRYRRYTSGAGHPGQQGLDAGGLSVLAFRALGLPCGAGRWRGAGWPAGTGNNISCGQSISAADGTFFPSGAGTSRPRLAAVPCGGQYAGD
jgi:hypothetical protein